MRKMRVMRLTLLAAERVMNYIRRIDEAHFYSNFAPSPARSRSASLRITGSRQTR
jgi:hypothetical protein